ncbi:acyl-CoA thioesterase [Catenulispora sp. NL8]|uniref:Acyl-CoA thioesterase n=1 Tax=Catenulispora pinistramenti TaxID=2705254 RepID=A0ABS5L122_9ACTN|nr:acyl-CoA thioester hydrolase/BAAT C-terminal domain-containing protein [Catenulispora pinistramenti]MBS2551942.1 acyl-CoA thioesterase [Catenulispora pinistramenti]
MTVVERELSEPWEAVCCEPDGGSEAGVVVLAGSSGRVLRERARILAQQGMSALAIRWFGGPGQPAAIREVPLETFTAAVDYLKARGARRIGVMGTSKGAEAALLTAIRDPRIDVVVGNSPTALVWGGVGPGPDGSFTPYRSSWSWQGEPVPFMPYDDSWWDTAPARPRAIRGLYELSERTFAEHVDAAAIPVEQARADLLLVAGGEDRMWPSMTYTLRLAERRRAAGRTVRLISHGDAGHGLLFPGETAGPASAEFDYGGSEVADTLLGKQAWPHVLSALRGD